MKNVLPHQLNDDKLIANLQTIVCAERRWQVAGILYLAEVDSRRLHLKLGYKSLFEFCVKRLGWSEGSVFRRTQVARKASHFPTLLDVIREQKMSLTVASLIAPQLASETADKMIREFCGLTRREAEDRLTILNKGAKRHPESIRSLGLHNAESAAVVSEQTPSQNPELALTASLASHSSQGQSSQPTLSRHSPPANEELFSFKFTGNRDLRDKVMRAKAVMTSKLKSTDMEKVFEAALDSLLDKHDPIRRAERAEKRQAKQRIAQVAKGNPPVNFAAEKDLGATDTVNSRYTPAELGRFVFKRSGHRCEWKSMGRRCSARSQLQIDHKIDHAKGGKTEAENLQVLCKAHNQLKARMAYGDAKIEQAIELARASRRYEARQL